VNDSVTISFKQSPESMSRLRVVTTFGLACRKGIRSMFSGHRVEGWHGRSRFSAEGSAMGKVNGAALTLMPCSLTFHVLQFDVKGIKSWPCQKGGFQVPAKVCDVVIMQSSQSKFSTVKIAISPLLATACVLPVVTIKAVKSCHLIRRKSESLWK
jgi:hypothetical protein